MLLKYFIEFNLSITHSLRINRTTREISLLIAFHFGILAISRLFDFIFRFDLVIFESDQITLKFNFSAIRWYFTIIWRNRVYFFLFLWIIRHICRILWQAWDMISCEIANFFSWIPSCKILDNLFWSQGIEWDEIALRFFSAKFCSVCIWLGILGIGWQGALLYHVSSSLLCNIHITPRNSCIHHSAFSPHPLMLAIPGSQGDMQPVF